MRLVVSTIVCLSLILVVSGCSGEKPVAESTESMADANAAASGWTPEAAAAFKNANARARSGTDNGPAGAPAKGK